MVRLGFVMKNLDTVIGCLEAAGATVITRPRQTEWGLEAVVRDPDGRNISITQPA
jgi:predicted enzyme related to lactoylglutathione lyase